MEEDTWGAVVKGGAGEKEDTWGAWVVVGIVGFLLGYAVFLVAEAATQTQARSVFLGIMSGVAFVTASLRR